MAQEGLSSVESQAEESRTRFRALDSQHQRNLQDTQKLCETADQIAHHSASIDLQLRKTMDSLE